MRTIVMSLTHPVTDEELAEIAKELPHLGNESPAGVPEGLHRFFESLRCVYRVCGKHAAGGSPRTGKFTIAIDEAVLDVDLPLTLKFDGAKTEGIQCIPTDAPIGTICFLRIDDDSLLLTRTRSMPWPLFDSRWVVCVEGRTGGYALERVLPFEAVQKVLPKAGL